MSDTDPDAADDRDAAAAGVAHLQRAGREFVSAARSFLDAVEEVVEDRTRLGELAESFTGFLGELSEAARGGSVPWGAPVRTTRGVADDDSGSSPTADSAHATDSAHAADTAHAAGSEPTTESEPDPSPSVGLGEDHDRPQPGARVRRIPVD